jgi:16S rRNA (guanine1207-N2)-methyltransferase
VHDASADPGGWDRATLAGVPFSWRLGCRGHPDPPPDWALLTERAATLAGEVLDASACLGVPARAAGGARATVLEPSAVALAALRRDLAAAPGPEVPPEVRAGLPWDAPADAFDHALLAPPAERGTARVHAELAAAARALRRDGSGWALLDKDRGAKRYVRDAGRWFGRAEVVARRKGARLVRLEAPREDAAPEPWRRFVTELGPAWALAGCYAAGKLDPGSARLLADLAAAEAIPAGATALDLGCGWGPLARAAADRGAVVVASDDDLAAVRSCARTVPEARVLHADRDLGLAEDERFARVLLNPPFHVGAGVRLELARALLRAARRRVAKGGELWLVANAQLPYEGAFAPRDRVDEVSRAGGFKVLRVRVRSGR